MAMPALARRWTREDVLELPDDGNRYELVAGELGVTPSPRSVHQDAILALYDRLAPFVRAHQAGHLSIAPADLQIRPGEIYQPDLFVVPLLDGRKPREWHECGTPLLVVEILSPTTARFDRTIKRPALQQAGVGEVWLVDLDARLVERWRPDDTRPEVLIERLDWRPVGVQASLDIDLGAYFAAVLD